MGKTGRMDFAFATAAAPGRANEDHLLLSAEFAVLLDGVTQLPGLETGCVHGPVWLVRRLGAHLTTALSADPAAGLDDVLAGAIEAVCRDHAGTCDLTNPNSPSSTVAIVRERGELLEYLVLCDSSVVFEHGGRVEAVSDGRTGDLLHYDRESVARVRNRPGGFWVASTAPQAAGEAVRGSVPLDGLSRLLVCTDGISRLVEFFGSTWPSVFELAERQGPRAVIDAVRVQERVRPELLTQRGRRFKQHDDATLALRLR